jgi:hypothetical protein
MSREKFFNDRPTTYLRTSRYYRALTMVYNTQRLMIALSKGPNRVGVFPHLRTETDFFPKRCFLVISNPDDGQSPKTQYLCIFKNSFNIIQPPLWYSIQSSWLQIQRSGFDSRCYQISFWDVVGLERGPLSLAKLAQAAIARSVFFPCGLKSRSLFCLF